MIYSDIKEVFKKEKLEIMIDPDDSNTICFPNYKNPQFKCDINSPLALGCITVLKAGFNKNDITLKKNKDDSISVIFDKIEIQKLVFKEATESIESDISNIKLSKEKTTIVLFNKSELLNQENSLASYLNYLSQYTPSSGMMKHVKDLRKEAIKQTGMYIEEYEGVDLKLKNSDILDVIKISHYNTFSNPIVLSLENPDQIKEQLEQIKECGDSENTVEIQANINSIKNIPIEAYNTVLNVSNYRDLDLEDVAKKTSSFLKTLIEQAKEYKQLTEQLQDTDNEFVKKKININIKKSLTIEGNSKKLYSLAADNSLLESGKKEILTYMSDNMLCVSSKGSCLGNGQHSTIALYLLHTLLNKGAESKIELFEKLNCSNNTLAQLFKVNAQNPYEKIREKLLKEINANGLTTDEFLSFFNKMKINVSWSIEKDVKTLSRKIENDNAQREQDRSDEWINEHKESISPILAKYKQVNSEVINKYKELGISLDITGIKTPDNTSGVAYSTLAAISLNEVYPYLSFILPPKKNLSTYENAYTETHSDTKKESASNLRNVYQEEVFGNETHKFWLSIFSKSFLNPGGEDTFYRFRAMITGEDTKSLLRNKPDTTFKAMGNTAAGNALFNNADHYMEKIPAVILFNHKVSQMYPSLIEAVENNIKDPISDVNFKKLCFFAFVSKVGKDSFNIENIEKHGDIILKDICNSFYEYYSNDENLILKTDEMKRKNVKNNSLEKLELLKGFMISLFEPLTNKINMANNLDGYKYLDQEVWKKTLDLISPETEQNFTERFSQQKPVKSNKRITITA